MADFRGEKLDKENSVKKVMFYHDTANAIKQISAEIFKKTDQIIHYPRGFEGGDKYKTIRKFIYRGFKGKLPVGVVKSVNFGYGFTKTLNPFGYYLNDNINLEEVIIEKGGKVELDIPGKKLYLNEISLETLQNAFSSIFKKNKDDVAYILKTNLNLLFPAQIPKPTKTYAENALATSLSSWGNTIDEFSDADKNAIKDLFDKLSLTTDFLTKDALAKTKEIVDVKYIQETLNQFKDLMKLKTDGEGLENNGKSFLGITVGYSHQFLHNQ